MSAATLAAAGEAMEVPMAAAARYRLVHCLAESGRLRAAEREYREFLAEQQTPALYLALAGTIDEVYTAAPVYEDLNGMAARYTAAPWLQQLLRSSAAKLRVASTPDESFAASANLLMELRDAIPKIRAASVRLEIIELGLRLEGDNFRAAAELREQLPGMNRRARLDLLQQAGRAAYGTGVINQRLLGEMQKELGTLDSNETGLDHYQATLSYLGRAPEWGTQALRMHFFDSMQKLAQIEPLAMLFIQDQLRGSPLLFYANVLDGLSRDANKLAGVTHQLFGKRIHGLRERAAQ